MRKIVVFSILLLISNDGLSGCMGSRPFDAVRSNVILTPLGPRQTLLPLITNELPGYFVAPNGNDANPGTRDLPWKTIEKASQIAGPGDTVYIRDGIYAESVSFGISGTETNPIRIMAYPGENPILDGGFAGYSGFLLNVSGAHIQISGIEVRNSKDRGIEVRGDYDVLDDVYVHHCMKAGIFITQGQHSTVQNSRVWRNSLINEYGQSDLWASGLSAARYGVAYATIRHNTVWENWGEGISAFEADHVTIEDNIVHDSSSGNIYISDATNVLCQRNFVYTDSTSHTFSYGDHGGIIMGDEKSNPPSSNITVLNNISFGNRWNYALFRGRYAATIYNVLIANNTFVNGIITGGVLLRSDHQNVSFANNLIQQDGPLPIITITDNPDVNFSNNLWSQAPVETASGSGDIIADPQLAKRGTPYAVEWFELTALSPAIDKALSHPEVTVDYFSNPRDNRPDMGAVEYIP